MASPTDSATLLDVIETKLKDTQRIPFISRIMICAKVVDRQNTQDYDIASFFSFL